uniref:MAP kinase kinase kinase-like protein n=1 Tax=Rhizophora mucronata TaxID=61149 RepID=A0A2P2N6C9_RHIMU
MCLYGSKHSTAPPFGKPIMSLLSRPTVSAKTLNKIARGRHEPCFIFPSNWIPWFSNTWKVSSNAVFAGLPTPCLL